MRRERLYLTEILEAADAIRAFIASKSRDEFLRDDELRSAVLLKLIIIGEASARLSAELKIRYPEVPWPEVVAFRNMAVHEYFGISWPLVWETATEDAPGIRATVADIVHAEFPPGSSPEEDEG